MKIGDIEFEIESQEDQLQTAVDQILTTVTERMKDTRLAERQATPPRAETCKSVIQKLWEENWFNTPRGLDEVHTELARKGFHYDRTAVAGSSDHDGLGRERPEPAARARHASAPHRRRWRSDFR